MAVGAMQKGAYDFMENPSRRSVWSMWPARAGQRSLAREVVAASATGRTRFPRRRIIGRSPAMQNLRELIANVADTSANVLIEGETGTGKELVARCLHDFSRRHSNSSSPELRRPAGKPVRKRDFRPRSQRLHRRRQTAHRQDRTRRHAVPRRSGKHAALQIKLLRVLQERTLERLGSNQSVAVDCRVIAATKSDLDESSKAGECSDLYYRLNVVTLELPPLRERREDILQLFEHFLQQSALRFDRAAPELDNQTLSNLMSHDWPGNVRELRNVAERFALGLPAFKKPGASAGNQGLALPKRWKPSNATCSAMPCNAAAAT
jgi:two-component system response regulator AauR